MTRATRALTKTLLAGAAAALLTACSGALLACGSSDHASSGSTAAATTRTGGGGAEAATGGAVGDLAVAARYLGLSPAQLDERLRAGLSMAQVTATRGGTSVAGLAEAIYAARATRLRMAVAAGRISTSAAAALSAGLPQRIAARVQRIGAYGLGAPARLAALRAAAGYLGVPVPQLRRMLRAGRTPAQLASATAGRSPAGLTAVVVAAERRRLAAAVAAGKLSAEAEHAALKGITQRIAAELGGPALASGAAGEVAR